MTFIRSNTSNMESESGISLMARLAVRPQLNDLFGPNAGSPRNVVTPIFSSTQISESVIFSAFVKDVICRMSLPKSYKGVTIGGCAAGVLFFNCDHHVKEEAIAEEMQRRVKVISEDYYKTLPKEKRSTDRLTSRDQWEIVKRSLERVLILNVNKPSKFEISLVGLKKVFEANQSISLVIINSINTFFHQVSESTGVYHNVYLRRLLIHIVEAVENVNQNLRVIYTQLNLFNKEDNFHNRFKPSDKLSIIKDKICLGESPHSSTTEYLLQYADIKLIKQL